MAEPGENTSPAIPQKRLKRYPQAVEAEINESILSPRFRSAAAMAGWDEEALLFATLIVEDTPVRESSRQKRSRNQLKSSTSSVSNRKQKSRRQPVDPIPAVVLCLDDDDDEGSSHQEVEKKEKGPEGFAPIEENKGNIIGEETCSSIINLKKGLPCMDKLREELSCAICLEICYEPSTTLCGHSFCKKCLKRAADKCGKKCPKCRQLISNGRSCTVNTVLWNTIQLLFPEEVEPRKKAAIESSSREKVSSHGSELERIRRHARSRNLHSSTSSFRSAMEVLETGDGDRNIVRRPNPSQSEDAALALRLQREELLQTFSNSSGQQRNSLYTTRARLRSMALGLYRVRNRS